MELINKECPRCSGPLVEVGDELQCQYCGAKYYIPENLSKRQNQEINAVKKINHDNDRFPQAENAPVQIDLNANKKKFGSRIFILLVIIVTGLALYAFYSTRSNQKSFSSPEQQFEQNWTNESRFAVVGFSHQASLSSAISFNYITSANWTGEHLMVFDLHLMNNTVEPIQTNLKDYHLQVNNVSFTDNFGEKFTCNLYPSDVDSLEPGKIYKIGWMECPKHLPPEVKALNFSVDFENWGIFKYEVPIVTNTDMLQINYFINADPRIKDKRFSISVDFSSEEPQLISMYFDSISMVDDWGNIYKPDSCHGSFQNWGRFVTGKPHSYIVKMIPAFGGTFTCSFEGPFAYETNQISVAMTIRGETILGTGAVDNIDGFYKFTREPIN